MRGRRLTPPMLRPVLGQGIPGVSPEASFAGPGDARLYFDQAERALWQEIAGRVPQGLLTPGAWAGPSGSGRRARPALGGSAGNAGLDHDPGRA